jgi:hypothetical protein
MWELTMGNLEEFIDLGLDEADTPPNICTVRLSTSYWRTKRGAFMRKSLIYLQRQCSGFNVLDEDMVNIGADEVVSRIVNLHKMPDGIYHITVCNERRDYESGMVDDYDYQLTPVMTTERNRTHE